MKGIAMRKSLTAMATAALLLTAVTSYGQDNVVGFTKVTVPASSDVLVSVPFTAAPAATMTVTGKDGTSLTVGDTLTANQYATTYYIRMTSGTAEGRWSTVTSNTTSTLVLTDTSFLSDVANGDTFKVFAHATLDGVFPAELKGRAYEASASLLARKTEVLVPSSNPGINKSAGATYYYYNNAWRKVGASPAVNQGGTVLSPDSYFIVRNNGGTQLTFVSAGTVQAIALARVIPTDTSKNDVPAVTGRVTPVTLAQLGLGGTAAFQTSTSILTRKDELLVFDNGATGINKSAAATYFYYNGAWRKVGASPATSFDGEVLPAGAAVIIRKAAGTAGSSTWTQVSPY